MPKAYRIQKRVLKFDKENPREVFTVMPVSYGLLTTDDAARQIATESSLTPGDVKNVLDRYAHYVVENLKKGYSVQLLGFGTLNVRFIKSKTVSSEKMANATMVKGLVPGFTPSYTKVNGSRVYDLLPDKIQLVKYGALVTDETSTTTPDEGGGSGSEVDPDNPLG